MSEAIHAGDGHELARELQLQLIERVEPGRLHSLLERRAHAGRYASIYDDLEALGIRVDVITGALLALERPENYGVARDRLLKAMSEARS